MNAVNKKTILLVEDEAVASIAETKTLQKFGYTVIASATGEEAVEIALKNKKNIDLILMDINLGNGIDGTDAAEIILKSCDIPVVFLSSHTEPEIVEKTEKITSYGYVVKNSSNTVLDASIKMAFKLFDAHKKAEIELAERKVTGHALRENEVQYRHIIERVNDTVWLMDMGFKTIWVSPSVIRSRGFTLEELQQIPLEDHMTKDSLNKAMALYAKHLTPERLADKNDTIKIKDEFEYYRKDGSTLFGETEVILQRNEDGIPYGFLCIGTDITSRKKVEENLQNSEEQYRIILEGSSQGILSVDIESRKVLYSNPAICKMFGYSNEEFIKLSLENLHPKDSLDRVFSDFNKRVISDTHVSSALPCLRKNGTVFYADLTASKSKINGKDSLVGFFIDITERMQIEENLRQNELKYQQLFNYAPTGIYEVDYVTGRFKKVNSVMVGYTGYTETELLSMNPLDIMTDDSKKSYLARLDKILAGENVIKNPEYCIKEKNGRLRWVELYTEFLRHERRIVGAAVVAHDITDRKNTEKILLNYNKTMLSINEFSLALSCLSYNEVYPYIVKKIKSIFNVKAAFINIYDEKASDLIFTLSTLSDEEHSKITKLFGTKLIGHKTHVDEEHYKLLTTEHAGMLSSLHDISFGTIPEFICRGLEKLFGIEWFMPVVLINKGRLTGTIVIAGNHLQEAPGREEILLFARITANVLDQKKAELQREEAVSALRYSENLYRTTFNAVNDIIHVVDTDLRMVLYNESLAVNSAIKNTDDLKGKFLLDIFPFLPKAVLEEYKTVLKTGKPLFSEDSIQLEGILRYSETQKFPIKDKDGNIYQILTVVRDISERKLTEEKLQKNEKQLKMITDNIPAFVNYVNAQDLHYIFVNKVYADSFNMTTEQIIGRQVKDILSEEAYMRALPYIERAQSGERISYENIVPVQGEPRLFNVNYIPEFDEKGKVRNLIVLAFDITYRNNIESALLESEKKFRSYIENAPEGIFVINSEGSFVDINDAGCNLFGYARDQLLIMNFLHVTENKDFKMFIPLIEILKTGASFSKETRFVRRDGSVFTGLTNSIKINDDRFLVFAKDITERKQEAMLIEAERDLGIELSGINSLNDAFMCCLKAAMSVSEMDSGGIYIVDDSESITLVAHKGLSDVFIEAVSHYSADMPNALIVQNGIPVYVDRSGILSDEKNILNDDHPISFAVNEGIKSLAIVPVIMMDKAIACMNISSHTWESIPKHARKSLERIASRMGLAIFRIKAEEELKKSDGRYRRLHESMMDAFIEVDMDGKILETNNSFNAMLGYTSEELSLLTYSDITPEKWHIFEKNIVEKQIMLKGYSDVYEKEYRRKDGSIFPIELRTFLVKDPEGRAVSMWAIVRDITERKLAEDELRKYEDKYR